MSNAYTTVIPFNRLRLSAANVRRTGRDTAKYRTGIKALAASILSIHKQTGQGLLQNLVVHVNGEFMDVAAGGRRYDCVALLIDRVNFRVITRWVAWSSVTKQCKQPVNTPCVFTQIASCAAVTDRFRSSAVPVAESVRPSNTHTDHAR